MTTLGLELALAGVLLAPAQQQPVQITTGTPTINLTAPDTRPAVDEQIEVMRALLLAKLADGHALSRDAAGTLLGAVTQSLTYQPMTHPDGRTTYEPRAYAAPAMSDYIPPSHWTWTRGGAPIAVEGVHFLGNGFTFVVFTVTMPPTGGDPRPSADPAAAPAGQSDWERLQRQLRGETAPASAALERKAPTVGDVLLHLLAENGKHFTALRDDERLTVAVTFRGPRPDARQPIVTTFQPQPAANALNLTGTLNVSGGTVTVTTEQTARDLELLGDLHLKQQKYAEALDALHKAVTAVENDLQKNPSGPERRQELERLSSLYSKLAQAQLATGRMDEARATLERARGTSQEATRTAQGQTTAPAAAKPGGSVLPARLTLSAPKRLLDEVGSGKMSFEQFRKQVTVEYVPATGGKATK